MKRILVPTDFSSTAHKALNYAIELAKAQNAKIILLNVMEIMPPSTEWPATAMIMEAQVDLVRNATDSLKKLGNKVKEHGLAVEEVCREGVTVSTILHIAENKKVDLIVMGTDGASGLERIFLGSNTAAVLERASCPVIAVPSAGKFHGLKRIVYALNYKDVHKPALKQVADLARLFDAEITLLHIAEYDDPVHDPEMLLEAFTRKVREETRYPNITSKVILASDVENRLDEYVDRRNADLFVMSAHKRSIFDRLFGKSLTKRMAYHSKMPLMAFHHKENSVTFI